MKNPVLLAIDNGTQSVRAIAFDLDGQQLAAKKVEIEPYFSEQPGYAEQHADVYWRALCEATRGCLAALGDQRSQLVGVAVTTQRGTVIPVDRDGAALRPALTWLDEREATALPPLPAHLELVFRAIGERDTIDFLRRQSEVNYVAYHEPEVWARTHKVLLLSGYLNHRLTDRFVDSIGSQVAYLPFDYKHQRWCSAHAWQWRAMAIRPAQLPELHKPGASLGRVTARAAAETGLPEGLPVLAAGADKACEVLGSGCFTPEVGCISYGTTATINAASDRYVEPVRLLPAYPAAIPDAYNVEVQVRRGFWMVQWFKDQFGAEEVRRAREDGVAAEQLFDAMIRDVPPGSLGLTLQPYWSPGVRTPGREAKGAIIGFGDVHTRAHVYRAILEGLAYGLRDGAERIEARIGTRMGRIRISGGGSQSDQAMQITADVFGRPTERPHTFETSALGAAINVAVGVGLLPDHRSAVARMTRRGTVFTPRPEAVRTYDALFRRVYRPMYGRLAPLYHAIRDITGYPR